MTPSPASHQPLSFQNTRFRPEFLDFRRGIHVGNLKDNERITRILKLALESRYRQIFVTDRWGRGVYWQWIGYLAKANRAAKPISSNVSFGCSKFFIMIDKDERLFKCGLQVERGFLKAPEGQARFELRDDWDWHRLLKALKPKGPMEKELKRLVTREGFWLRAGSWHSEVLRFSKSAFPTMSQLRSRLEKAPGNGWAGFMMYFPMDEQAVQRSSGTDLVESMIAIFEEVTPAMRLCTQTPL